MIIGATFDDAGATNAGSVYLFSVPAPAIAPSLTIRRTTTNTVVMCWPSAAAGFVLQQNTNLNTTNWTTLSELASDNGTIKFIAASLGASHRSCRLFKP